MTTAVTRPWSTGPHAGPDSLEERVQRLEDLEDIRALAVRYGFAVDERDFEVLEQLFSPDAALRTAAGRAKGEGLEEVVGYFRAHLPQLGPTNHFTHGHLVTFLDGDRDRATGMVSSHAEVWRDGKPMVTAMRYLDAYVRHEGAWKFSERIQSYMYFVDVREYPEALGDALRVRAGASPSAADWPVALREE
jgi:ketosteroid isomerase-like protein